MRGQIINTLCDKTSTPIWRQVSYSCHIFIIYYR